MTDSPLSIAFLWHMHQPYYKDPFSGMYRMPWVRLHGTKDYLDMVSILEDYPQIRQTFNLVPSLLEQIRDYTEQGATDLFLEVTRTRAADLREDDRIFLLEHFFLANWETMIRPFPRFHELLLKRGIRFSRDELFRTAKYFTTQDILDLQVLFNLVWIDPLFRDSDAELMRLVSKGKGFTEEEKEVVIQKQLSILHRIIPAYKEMSHRRQIELTTTPFYHPILPLLWDTAIARLPVPDVRLPKRGFSHPEDVYKQISMAIDYFEALFGYRPAGMWPSEGSVSEDVAKAMHAKGIQWIATDEDILAGSLREGLRDPSGTVRDPSVLYSVYEYHGLSMIFRDHRISDLLGFVYSGWDPKSAATDLINRLLHIRHTLPANEPRIVSIILDGENAWEYYRDDGRDFFRYLYEGLSREDRLRTVTVSDFMREHQERKRLDYLAAGSWIYGNFGVWIGHSEDNTAWDYLADTRASLAAFQQEHPGKNLDAAWKALYVAEGSDWNWWYGDDHSTELAEEFDELYRLNLMKVYKEMGKDVPAQLFVPVLRQDRATTPAVEIRGFINPRMDGIMTSYFEWYHAAYCDVGKSGGSMHMSEGLLSRIYYGFNRDNLFLRVDPKRSFGEFPEESVLVIDIAGPVACRVVIIPHEKANAQLLGGGEHGWVMRRKLVDVAVDEIAECAIPFEEMRAREHDELQLSVSIVKGSEEIERCPWRGYISVVVPTPNFEAMMWY